MKEEYEDINIFVLSGNSYHHLTRQQLIDLFEDQKKKNEKLSKEINKQKEIIISTEINLGYKEKEIGLLNKIIEEKENYADLIKKGYEDYKQLSHDLKIMMENFSGKNESIKNPIGLQMQKLLDNSKGDQKILLINMMKNEEKEDLVKIFKKDSTLSKKKEKKTTRTKNKDPDRVKRPLSPFFLFLSEKKQDYRNKGIVFKLIDFCKLCGKEWKTMTPEQKEPYQKLFLLNKEKYLRDLQNLNMDKKFKFDQNVMLKNSELNNFNQNNNGNLLENKEQNNIPKILI